ncbi:TetR/AcrR family transcriptional regulator [Caldimonas sp. KR1-144]|uniref:TetR/AcrR family transcriptional regulator n=1 Tax=Caldimonas sp. KR1-144 TaxID=3400911 RepID=UPI003BFDA2A4
MPGPRTEADSSFFRREPRQARSREMVTRILAAARVLLERDGLQRLTTNHIAREAGVDIASLYQYFASKEAILYTLAEQWVQQVQGVYARHRAAFASGDDKTPMLRSLRDVFDELEGLPGNDWNWKHLAPPMAIVPVLRELEAEHETVTAAFWAAWLRHHGVSWPDERLEAFARMLYVQIDSALTLAGRMPPEQARWVRRWQRRQTFALLRECFPRRRSDRRCS